MKVLHVCPYIHPIYGGPGVVIRSMAEALISNGGFADIVTTNAAGMKNLPTKDGMLVEENGILIKYFNCISPRSWFYSSSMRDWLNKQTINYDLIHLHVPFTAPFRYGALAAQSSDRPYVVTMHGLLDKWCLSQKSWKKLPYFYLLERSNIKSAKAIHVTSPLEKEFLKNLNIGPDIYCIPPAVTVNPHLISLSSKDNCHRILCIARLHPVKALPILFMALSKIRQKGVNVVLDLAGDGEENYILNLKRQAEELGVKDAIIWHGHVDEKSKKKLFKMASCAVLISYHENFGLSAAEALAAGIPVVVSDQVGVASDINKYGVGKVVSVGDAAGTAEAIISIINQVNGSDIKVKAHTVARDIYGEHNFNKRLIKFYEEAQINAT